MAVHGDRPSLLAGHGHHQRTGLIHMNTAGQTAPGHPHIRHLVLRQCFGDPGACTVRARIDIQRFAGLPRIQGYGQMGNIIACT